MLNFFVMSTTPNFTLLFTVIPDHGSTLSASSLLLSGHICRLFGFISQCQSSVRNKSITLNIFQLRIRTESFRWFYEKYVFVVIICCSNLYYSIFVAVFGQMRAVCLDSFSDHCIFVSPYYYY